jgi:hypothetical protein
MLTLSSTDAIAMHYNMILANLHEPALYDGHDWRDFRPPYKLRSLLLMNKMYDDIALDTASALDCCIKSAEAIIHTFLNVTISTLRSVPVIMYARTVYAVVILIKFDVSAQNLLGAASLLQKDSSSKNLLLQLIEKLQNAVGPEGFQIPATFCAILSRMATWYIEHVDDSSPFFEQRFGDNAIEPLEQLNPDSAPWNESRGSSWECPQMARPNSCEWHNTADLWLGTMQVRPASNNPNASTYLGIGTQQ